MADKFTFGSAGEIQDVEFALARNGWTHSLLKKATGGNFFGQVLEVLEGRAEICRIEHLSAKRRGEVIFARDMRKEGWKLLEHTPHRITSADLELVSFLKPGEDYIGGEEMVRRARYEYDANYGQEDAEWLLGHQIEIPEEFQNYHLVFPGTVWLDSNGDRRVPYPRYSGKRWELYLGRLKDDFDLHARLVRPRK